MDHVLRFGQENFRSHRRFPSPALREKVGERSEPDEGERASAVPPELRRRRPRNSLIIDPSGDNMDAIYLAKGERAAKNSEHAVKSPFYPQITQISTD